VQSINVKSLLLPDATQREKRVAELTQQRDSATNALTKQRLNDQLTINAAIN
jgi:2',3'-cyclic-nucleotide 2'-phosphodiesterase/3'-nucleotidase